MTIFKGKKGEKLTATADAVAKQFKNVQQLTVIGNTVYIVSTDGLVFAGRFKDGAIVDVKQVPVMQAN